MLDFVNRGPGGRTIAPGQDSASTLSECGCPQDDVNVRGIVATCPVTGGGGTKQGDGEAGHAVASTCTRSAVELDDDTQQRPFGWSSAAEATDASTGGRDRPCREADRAAPRPVSAILTRRPSSGPADRPAHARSALHELKKP